MSLKNSNGPSMSVYFPIQEREDITQKVEEFLLFLNTKLGDVNTNKSQLICALFRSGEVIKENGKWVIKFPVPGVNE